MDFNCMIKELADQYSSYFSIDNSEEIKQFEESVEENLTHLEEFCSVLDLIRNEDIAFIEKLIPGFVAKAAQMETFYRQIDKLEKLVKVIKTNVEQFEIEVNKAEEFFSNQITIKKFFNTWLNNKKTTKVKVSPKYVFPSIFKYENYINCSESLIKQDLFTNFNTNNHLNTTSSNSKIGSNFSDNCNSEQSFSQPST